MTLPYKGHFDLVKKVRSGRDSPVSVTDEGESPARELVNDIPSDGVAAPIGPYTFEEFKEIVREFHGYPAPGVLIGGYMVEAAKARLPAGLLFEVVVETKKCLPDAVQLLTPCTTGNNWMRVVDLGRYALSMHDKHTGIGVRAAIDPEKLKNRPAINNWFFRLQSKSEQDSARLLEEIGEAGASILSLTEVRIREKYVGKPPTESTTVCPVCNEAYPHGQGPICRGCQGEAPYVAAGDRTADEAPRLTSVPVTEAVGQKALHDMTEIIPGKSKEPAFKAGGEIRSGDICRLQRMGRNHVYLEEHPGVEWVHENDAVKAFAERIAGPGISYRLPPKEGKIEFLADYGGLLDVDVDRLLQFNLCPDVMLATRHNNSLVEAGHGVGGCRAIPLFLSRTHFARAVALLGNQHLLKVLPLQKSRTGVLITGTEVFKGLVQDRFLPIVTAKVEALGCTVVDSVIAPDESRAISEAVARLTAQDIDLLVTTGGMSVDPEDITRRTLLDLGAQNVLYGVPVLPGTMTLLGRLGNVRIIGVPACALFHRTTALDLLLPRLLAGKEVTRKDLALLSEGGYCLGCESCVYPECPYGK